MNNQQTIAASLFAVITISASIIPAFADTNQYPPPPASLLNAPSIKGGELEGYQSVYPTPQKSFWGDDAISQQFVNAGNQLNSVSHKAMQLINGNPQPPASKLTPEQARYLSFKDAFEKRARELNEEQSRQYIQTPQTVLNPYYRWLK